MAAVAMMTVAIATVMLLLVCLQATLKT